MTLDSRKKIKVGCAQIDCVLGDVPSNFNKHMDLIKEAKSKACDLLVFPELSLKGYELSDFGCDLAIPKDSDFLIKLAEEAGADMSVIVGFVEEGHGGLIYNSAALLNNGRVCFVHRKMSLPTFGCLDEGKYYAEGRTVKTHRLSKEWSLSSLICQDVWQPSLVHVAAMKGATLFISPFCSAIGGMGAGLDSVTGWDIVSKYISMTYGMPSVICNRVGREKNFEYWGGSRILDPYGRVLAQARQGEELIYAELNYDDVKKARYALPIVRDCRIDTTIRELKLAAAGDFGETGCV